MKKIYSVVDEAHGEVFYFTSKRKAEKCVEKWLRQAIKRGWEYKGTSLRSYMRGVAIRIRMIRVY